MYCRWYFSLNVAPSSKSVIFQGEKGAYDDIHTWSNNARNFFDRPYRHPTASLIYMADATSGIVLCTAPGVNVLSETRGRREQ